MISQAWLKSLIEGALIVLWDVDVPDHDISATVVLARAAVDPPQSELERLLLLGVTADVAAKRRTLDDVSRIARVRAYIHAHSRDSNLSRPAVARGVGLSDSWLAHNLKLETGRSFRQHLIDCRLADALRVLTQSTDSVKDVALTVGFPSDNALTSLVRKRFGMAPGEWRRAQGTGHRATLTDDSDRKRPAGCRLSVLESPHARRLASPGCRDVCRHARVASSARLDGLYSRHLHAWRHRRWIYSKRCARRGPG